jgi:hypothetical protein
MSGTSSFRSFFTKTSDGQNAEVSEDSQAFKRARFWFWPIVLSLTICFGFFAGLQGAFIGFFYGLVAGGFLLHESLRVEKK